MTQTDRAKSHITLRLVERNMGFCRFVYESYVDGEGTKHYYCFQDEGKNCGGIAFYKCSGPDWFEPSHVVRPKDIIEVELPNNDDSELGLKIAEYVANSDCFVGVPLDCEDIWRIM